MDKRLKSVEEGLREVFPIESTDRIVELERVYADEKTTVDPEDAHEMKRVKLQGGTFGVPVYVELVLKDKKTGKVLDKKKRKIGMLPVQTKHKTYIINGTEYQHNLVQRLKPGIYVRQKSNNDYEAAINPNGFSRIAISINDKDSTFRTKVGSSNPALYPVLTAMGVSDKELEKVWGRDVLEINKKKFGSPEVAERELRKFYKKTVSKNDPEDIDELKKNLRLFFENSKLDEEATKFSTGTPHNKMDEKALLTASKRLLNTYRGVEKPDSQTEIYYQTFNGEDTFLKERLEKLKYSLPGKFRRKLNNSDKISDFFQAKPISDTIERTYTTSQNSSATSGTNLLDILSSDSTITLKGPGGIRSTHAVTNDDRDLTVTAIGVIDPVKTPAGAAGITLHKSVGAKFKDNDIKLTVYDLKNKKEKEISITEYFSKKVALPGEFKKDQYGRFIPKKKTVSVINKDQVSEVPASEVDYVIPDPKQMFSEVTNMIPFLNANSGPRAIFGANQITQAVPLKYREERMVQTAYDDKRTFDEVLAEKFLHKSPLDGKVKSVSEKKIVIEDKNGKEHTVKLYDNYPISQGSFLDSTPLVKEGDTVKQGQIVADNNYTKNGKLALGQNLVVAFMPYKGYTHEDGIVVSETGARKLTSEHVRMKSKEIVPEKEIVSLDLFHAYAPSMLSPENKAKLGKDGVIKEGAIVNPGDVIIAGVRKPQINPTAVSMNIAQPKKLKWVPNPTTWDKDVPGKVINVVKTPERIEVYIRTEEPAVIGDKISNAAGAKGVITKIVPDDEAPRRKSDGKVVDLIIDPHGVPSRMNLGQLYELAAGKIAEKTKKPFVVKNFEIEDYRDFIKEQMKKYGVPDKETIIIDKNKEVPNINVGRQYIYKLEHQVDKKMSVRDMEKDGYNVDDQPIKGKKMDFYTTYAMIAHGARENLREMATRKRSRQEDGRYWHSVRSGININVPESRTFAYKKFESYLRGLGLDPRMDEQRKKLQLVPLTDEEIVRIAPKKITSPDTLNKATFKPQKGGLFDPEVTGYETPHPRYTRIELPEKMPNPVFERPITQLLGLKQGDIKKIVAGEKKLNGKTGPQAIEEALKAISVDESLAELEKQYQTTSSKHIKSDIAKKMRYLKNLKELGKRPEDVYMMKNVPVIPPNMRPITVLPNGTVSPADINYHYHNVALHSLKTWDDVKAVGKEDLINKTREEIYEGMRKLMGTTTISDKNKDEPKGILNQLAGAGKGGPKEGFYHRKVLYGPQELTARSVITVDPYLGVDEIGYPEEIAWVQFAPFIERRLRTQFAMDPVKAKENIKKRTPVARKALLQETEERPVFINRAPSWHRFNILAMKPKLVPGKEIRVPNLPINSYMGGDFDGDTVTIHVPIGQKAVEEAKMMFPSKSLFKPGTRAGDNVKLMLQPEQSAVIGLNYLSRVGSYKDKPSFKSELEATASLKGGKIRADQPIIVAGKETTAGKILLKDVFPKDMPWTEGEITTSNLKKYLLKLAKEKPDEYGFYVNRINFFGEQYSAEAGFSVGIEDLVKLDDKIKPLLSQAERQSARARTPEEKIKALIELRDRAEKEIPKMIPQNNAFWQMMNISGKGNPNQIRQSLGAGLLYENAKGEIVPVPVKAPYAKGLSPAEYLIQQIGARKGIIDRSVETSKPGELGKRLLVSNADRVITMNDCGTRKGRLVNLKNAQDRAWALDHVLAEDTPVAPRGEVVTPAMIDELIKKGAETILVRSPLRCEAPRGLCAKCYGLNEKGEFPSIGDNVGVQESQTVMERSANFTLKAWHTSGASEKVSPFDRYAELVNVPRNIKNQAVVARVGGRIEEISKNSLGGYDIYINGEKHTTPPGVKPLTDPGDARAYDAKPIKVGDVVEPGDRLTTGNIRPQDLLNYKGLAPAQDYMSKELHGLLKDFGIQPKTVETVISGITNVAEIEDPGTSSFNYLDTAPINVLEDLNKQKEEIKHVNEAIGLVLSDDVRQYKKGTIVTPEIAMNLQLSGIREVKVEKKPIKYRPILNGIKTLPLIKSEDWLSNLDFVRVKDTIIDAASKGYKAPRHGYHPAGPYAIGVDFGKGDPDLPGSY